MIMPTLKVGPTWQKYCCKKKQKHRVQKNKKIRDAYLAPQAAEVLLQGRGFADFLKADTASSFSNLLYHFEFEW